MSTDSLQPANDDATKPADTPTNVEGDVDVPETFTATITVRYIQRFLDAIRPLDDECRLHVASDGMSACVVGKANATMAVVRLDASASEAYHTDGDGGVIGVPVRRLRKIVRMSNNSALMQLDLVDSETLRVRAGALDCSLQLRDPATMRSTSGLEPDEYPSVVVLEGGELKRILKAAGHVDSAVNFVQNDDGRFVAEADNGDDSFRAPRAADDLVEVFVGEESVASRFDLGYLRKTKRAIRKRTEVTLALGTDMPLSMAFDIADGAGHVEYGIAPIVEADD